jgi:hypothetical protein
MADNVGNRLGPRATFEYETDALETILYQQDRSVGEAVGNTIATTAARPSSIDGRYLRGRYVLVEAKDDPTVRKRIFIGKNDNTLFAADESQEVTINGVVFVTTGRVGERVSFLKVEEEET